MFNYDSSKPKLHLDLQCKCNTVFFKLYFKKYESIMWNKKKEFEKIFEELNNKLIQDSRIQITSINYNLFY